MVCNISVIWFRSQCVDITLLWRHNGRDTGSNHQPHHCLLNRLFGCRSKKISKLRVTDLCEGNSAETGEFPAQRASNAENVSIWWRHLDKNYSSCLAFLVQHQVIHNTVIHDRHLVNISSDSILSPDVSCAYGRARWWFWIMHSERNYTMNYQHLKIGNQNVSFCSQHCACW